MNPDLVDKVLSCERLPSLPAVALKVIELTQDPNVKFSDIAAVIANDQGLSAKILKTVNSSFYGLRQPCASINQSIVMLGMSAVKTLALGFSLVASLAEERDTGLDFQAYWQRSLYSGIGAKCIADASSSGRGEEAFLGGLLQDIGMIALARTLGKRYVSIVSDTNGDHRALARLELQELEVTHADIGALLATKWKLPQELILPIRFHERPTAAPGEALALCQCVALGNIAADVLGSGEPAVALKKFYTRGTEWLGLKEAQSDQIMRQTTQGTKEIAHLLRVDVGPIADVQTLQSKADQQLMAMTLPFGAETGQSASGADVDEATGLPARVIFNRNLVAGIEQAGAGAQAMSVVLIELDQLAALRTDDPRVADAALYALATMLRPHFSARDGLLCRYDDTTLAAFLPRTDRAEATRAAEEARLVVGSAPVNVKPPGLLAMSMTMSLSMGVATYDPAATGAARMAGADQLIDVTHRALSAAKRAGGSALRVYLPKAA